MQVFLGCVDCLTSFIYTVFYVIGMFYYTIIYELLVAALSFGKVGCKSSKLEK